MIALIGLGNPGQKHSLNRHNIGFIVIDELIDIEKLKKVLESYKIIKNHYERFRSK